MNDESVVSERRPADNRFGCWIYAALWIGIPLCMIVGLRAYVLWIPQVPFDPPTWRADEARARGNNKIPDGREVMLRDLLTNHLPGKNHQQIEEILGLSWTHESARIPDSKFDKVPNGNGQMGYPKSARHFFQSYEWDMLYDLSYERAFIFEHRGQILERDREYLIIRLGKDGLFESWYVYGSNRWPKIVGREAASRYRERR